MYETRDYLRVCAHSLSHISYIGYPNYKDTRFFIVYIDKEGS